MERPAFDRLLTATLPRIERSVLTYATRYNLRHEWRDIAQTALLKMLRFADYYDPGKGEFMPWACVVIINTIKTRLNQAATAPDMGECNALIIDTTPATSNPETDLQTSIILDNLNDEARLYVEDYNYREIAARCGFKSNVTAMTRIDNCAQRLRRVLGINAARGKRVKVYAKNPA